MRMSELFVPVPATSKPPKLPDGQFEFAIDRKARKIAGFIDFIIRNERIRVQTGRLFTWTGEVPLPDNTTGLTRDVDCLLEFEGEVERREEAARMLLQAALDAEFDFDALTRRLLTEAVDKQRVALGGTFLQVMRDAGRRTVLFDAIREGLRKGGLPVTTLSLRPIALDHREFLDFMDRPGSLAIRSSDMLEANTIGFKARLRWSTVEEHRNARLIYRGTITGPEPGPTLAAPLVASQIQPIEAWFRVLLADALARHPWSAVAVNESDTMEAVKSEVSALLGRGTGRILETIDILQSASSQPRLKERTMSFSEPYAITGVQGRTLTIEHTIGYGLRDRDRWESQGSPHPEEAIRPQVVEATRAFLAVRRFKDVVALYLMGPQGEGELNDAITARVTPFVNAIGVSLISSAVILSIPERDFIQGRRLTFDRDVYSLADPHLAPPMKMAMIVRVAESAEAQTTFARVLAEQDAFDRQVRTTILDAVRECLRRVSALQYYASHYAKNRLGDPDTKDRLGKPSGDVARETDDAVMLRLRREVDKELRAKFGMEVVRIDLEPDHDPLIDRLRALIGLSIPLPEHMRVTFERGDEATRMWLEADGSIFVVSLDPQNWRSFYYNAARIDTAEIHIDKIVETLSQTLRMTQAAIAEPGMNGLRAVDFRSLVVDQFTARVREELGLQVQLSPLIVRIKRPGAGDTSAVVLTHLRRELEQIARLRAELSSGSTYEDSDRRDALTERIKKIRREISEEEELQEETITRTEFIRIEQDRQTGRLLEG